MEGAEAVLAIYDLKARYGDLVDRRFVRGEALEPSRLGELAGEIAGLFTEDAEWDGGPTLGVARGRDEITARMAAPTTTFSRHFFVRPRVRVEDGRAWGRWDLLAPCRVADGTAYWMCGVEDDDYARGPDGAWLHRRMALTTVFMAPAPDGFGPIWL